MHFFKRDITIPFKKSIQTGILILILISLGLMQCGRETIRMTNSTPENNFEQAKRIFDKKNYYKAKMQFSILVLNNPASIIAEKAQFYLAESHYYLKEYIQAIAEYEKLVQSFPQSPFVDDARYKVGMCYYQLSPGYSLDQEYTYNAISQFQQFLEDFPFSDLKPEVEKRLSECLNKLARKEYKHGTLWRKMGYYDSAIISFDRVLNEFSQSEYNDDALYWKAECYRKMKQWDEALLAFEDLIDKYPSGALAQKAKQRIDNVRKAKEKSDIDTDTESSDI